MALFSRLPSGGDGEFLKQYPGCGCNSWTDSTTQSLTRGKSVTVSRILPASYSSNLSNDCLPLEGCGFINTSGLPLKINGTTNEGILFNFKYGKTLKTTKTGYSDGGNINTFEITSEVKLVGTNWYVYVTIKYLSESGDNVTVTISPIKYLFTSYTTAE